MSTEEKNLDTVKLSRIEHFVATVRRTVKDEDINNLETLADAVVAAGQN